jgi:hypothetical protein
MKRLAAFLALWTAIFSVAGLCALFPKVIAAVILVACVIMMLIVSWQFVETHVDN